MRDNSVINQDGEVEKAGCVVLNDHNEILLVTTKTRSEWALPKGHAEAGEALVDVALRETREETGYDVEIVKPLGDMNYFSDKADGPVRVHYFLARTLKQHGDAEGEWEWVDLDKAKSLVWASVKEFLDKELD